MILSICFTFLYASVAMGGNELGSSFPEKEGFQPDLDVTMFSVSVLFQLQIKLYISETKSRKNYLNRNSTHDFLWLYQGDFVKALGELHGHETTI